MNKQPCSTCQKIRRIVGPGLFKRVDRILSHFDQEARIKQKLAKRARKEHLRRSVPGDVQ